MEVKNHRNPSFQAVRVTAKDLNPAFQPLIKNLEAVSEKEGIDFFIRHPNILDPKITHNTSYSKYTIASAKTGWLQFSENRVTGWKNSTVQDFQRNIDMAIKLVRTSNETIDNMFKQIFKPKKYVTVSNNFDVADSCHKVQRLEFAESFTGVLPLISALAKNRGVKLNIRQAVAADYGATEDTAMHMYTVEVLKKPNGIRNWFKKPAIIGTKTQRLPETSDEVFVTAQRAVNKAVETK